MVCFERKERAITQFWSKSQWICGIIIVEAATEKILNGILCSRRGKIRSSDYSTQIGWAWVGKRHIAAWIGASLVLNPRLPRSQQPSNQLHQNPHLQLRSEDSVDPGIAKEEQSAASRACRSRGGTWDLRELQVLPTDEGKKRDHAGGTATLVVSAPDFQHFYINL